MVQDAPDGQLVADVRHDLERTSTAFADERVRLVGLEPGDRRRCWPASSHRPPYEGAEGRPPPRPATFRDSHLVRGRSLETVGGSNRRRTGPRSYGSASLCPVVELTEDVSGLRRLTAPQPLLTCASNRISCRPAIRYVPVCEASRLASPLEPCRSRVQGVLVTAPRTSGTHQCFARPASCLG